MPEPAETLLASATLVSRTSPQTTVMSTGPAESLLLSTSKSELTVAVLWRTAQSALVVVADRVMVLEVPLTKVPKSQERTPAVIEQSVMSSTDQPRATLGSVSVRVTPSDGALPPALTLIE